MQVIATANFKGGTGKTVTAINLAAELAAAEKWVLLIDADPQHNSTDFFLGGTRGDGDPLLYDVLMGYNEPYWGDFVPVNPETRVSVLGGDMRLLGLDLMSIKDGPSYGALQRFSDFVGVLRQDQAYDYILIDCPPSFTAASVAALRESDLVIIPTQVDAFSRAGVGELVEQIQNLRGAAAGLAYQVLITMADRTRLYKQGSDVLRTSSLPVYDTVIRRCTAVGESTYARKPLRAYAPKCSAAEDYAALAEEITEGGIADG